MHAEVCVIGAGLIGLASARELALRGATVRIFDARTPARAASWAGAGMLAPYSEAGSDSAMLELCIRSLQMYPAFVDELREATGFDPHFRRDGTIELAEDAEHATRLREHAHALCLRGVDAAFKDEAQIRELEPALEGAPFGGSFIADEAQVDNRRLGRALLAACAKLGVRIDGEVGDVAIEVDKRRVRGLRTARGFVAAPIVINAAGAWADRIAGLPAALRVPIVPIKGQMIALQMSEPLIRRLVWLPFPYLVPRSDGRLLIGATLERAGFDVRVSAGGVAGLLTRAIRAMPGLAQLPIVETWAGLRPGTSDGRPLLGPTSLEGYFIAGGHFRNGILLTPISALILADYVEGKTSSIDCTPFTPTRFATGQAQAAAKSA